MDMELETSTNSPAFNWRGVDETVKEFENCHNEIIHFR